jgi:hypothetical protein
MHRKFRAQHHGGVRDESMGQREVQGLQRRQQSHRDRPSDDASAAERAELRDATAASKSWDEFARPDSPPLDFVFTVCDKIAGEMCPVWPGQPITAHWGAADPAAFAGPDEARRRFFFRIYTELENRIKIFTSLPFDSLDRFALERRVREIGTVKPPLDK